jgi:hypothetical protein
MTKTQHMARCLRLAVVRNVLSQELISLADALDLLNAPLSPDDNDAKVYDDRDKLNWSQDRFDDWMRDGWGASNDDRNEG